MRKKKLTTWAVTSIVALSTSLSAIAAMPIPSGWYVEGNGGATRTSKASYGTGLGSSGSGFGWNVNGGFKFMPYFAGELGYSRFAKTNVSSNSTNIAKDNHYGYYLAGKGILPISDSGVELFAKLGIARLHGHVVITNPNFVSANGLSVNAGTHTSTGAYFGFGGDYNITSNFAINAQWNRAKGNSSIGNLDLYSLGLSYLFA